MNKSARKSATRAKARNHLQLKFETVRTLSLPELGFVAAGCDLGSVTSHVPPGGDGNPTNCASQ